MKKLEKRFVCPHCKKDIRIRNPSGKCDHLHYPEYCKKCLEIELGASKKIRKVFKYATGEEIPEGAVYLSTQVEKIMDYEYLRGEESRIDIVTEKNELVWHYFLVEVKVDKNEVKL